MIVFSDAVTCGKPIANPVSVSAADSGIGNTGCGWSPKASPENQRLVGGTRPSASRVGAILATFFLVIAARSALISGADSGFATTPVEESALREEESEELLVVQPATRATPAISVSGLASFDQTFGLPVLFVVTESSRSEVSKP